MKFDTFEAFAKAVNLIAPFSPFQFPELYKDALNTAASSNNEPQWCERKKSADKAIISGVVGLLRAAFEVHTRAAAQIGPGDDLLGYRIERAEAELPDGWQIVVQVRNGNTSVDLYNNLDERVQVSTVWDTLSGQVSSAIDTAKNLCAQPVKPVGGSGG